MASSSRPVRVLIVDDNHEFLTSMRRWVESLQDLELVGTASSAANVVELVSSTRPDFVLIDAVMPGLNGFEATRLIKTMATPPRVFVMSFYASAPAREEAKSCGADGFLAKTELTAQLAQALGFPGFEVRPVDAEGPEDRPAPETRLREADPAQPGVSGRPLSRDPEIS